MYDAVCLASGGLDSLVCMHLMKRGNIRALPVFVNYGQRNLERELLSLTRNVEAHGFPQPIVVDVSGFGRVISTGLTDVSKDVYVDAFTPNRNLLFLTLGASVAFSKGASTLVVGFLAEETAIFPDQTEQFLRAVELSLAESLGVKMNIVCPLRDMLKQDVVRLSQELEIGSSYSCHSGTSEPCGKCIACLEYKMGG